MLSQDLIDKLRSIGEFLTIKGNQSIYWDDARFVWFVVKGEVNVFAVPQDGQEILGKREYLFSVDEGELLVGVNNEKSLPFRLHFTGMSETEIIQIEASTFAEWSKEKAAVTQLINDWENKLLHWMEQQELNQLETMPHDSPALFLTTVYHFLDGTIQQEADRLQRLIKIDQDKLSKALLSLQSTMNIKQPTLKSAIDSTDDILIRTCQLIGVKTNINIKAPLNKQSDTLDTAVRQIAKSSNVRIRLVTLNETWSQKDNGALLCFMKEDHRPVALIPASFNKYELHDLTNDTVQKMTVEMEKELLNEAYVFYRPFPAKKLSLIDLVKYSAQTSNVKKDFVALIVLGILGGLLGLAIPIGLGELVDNIIPAAERSKIADFVLILVAIAVAIFTFELTRSLAMLRIEGKLDAHVQAAVWDRVLNLPVPFFRKFSAGDLALRANSISVIRQTLSGTTLAAIFTGLFSITQFVLLFFYSPKLALIATALIVIIILSTFLFGYTMVRNERVLAHLNGKLTGIVFQIINGIAKFRISGSEKRVYGLWSDHFSNMRKVSFKTGTIQNNFETFNAIYPIIATIVLFYSVITFAPTLSTGAFLAFYSAFTGFITSMMTMTLALISALGIVPLYERAKPILETLPEIDDEKEEIADLQGQIEVNQVDFRYDEEGPLILQNVSLRVNPGEFVAIVGTSGSGKSTLMRLLLGFEKPSSGSVYYDQQDLAGLDVQSVRSKLGVVLQGGQILAGDIFTNIVGSSNLTMNDAWEAAKMAGLDADIKKMPMGMFTVVDEGARTLSGGQRQRLLIARALVHKPKIIFFDEATSALDNRTQKIVSDSIGGLHATRIVIAHRLSTIINADRIYVLEKGKIVEEGTFQSLMDQNGVFAQLAKRQMA